MDHTNNPHEAPKPEAAPQPLTPAPTVSTAAAPATQPNLENVTINTATVESKVGLYTRVVFTSLWILAITGGFAIATLINSTDGAANIVVFAISVAVIAAPIFAISNSKRNKEFAANPELTEDIFVKKALRKNLFAAITLTSLAAFFFVFTLLSTLFLNEGDTDNAGKTILSSLVWTVAFGGILAFCWGQHARTKK